MNMKVLLAGDWHSELHEEAMSWGLQQLGHDVNRFEWHKYFSTNDASLLNRLLFRAQNKYLIGPTLNKMNLDFMNLAQSLHPDVIFIYRGTHIYSTTLRKLKKLCPNAVLVGYNNDDPFSPMQPRWYWRHYKSGIPEYDMTLAYRIHNMHELQECGAKNVRLLRSWFLPERNHPTELTEEQYECFGCDVAFVGHYEDDGRLQYLEEVVRRGWKLRIFGHGYGWDSVLSKSRILRKHSPVRTVWGDEYNLAICGAKVALCFLSKLNRDTYTRRCFEIPASGVVMMSEYSRDLTDLYKPDVEAVFFEGIDEFGDKLDLLMQNEQLRASIAAAGHRRVWADRHDIVSRMSDLMDWVVEAANK
jgi:hypothetical protein